MTNPFTRHGIEHLSPSTLNTWAAQPAIVVLEKLLKRRGNGVSMAALRGTACETGIVEGLMDPRMPVIECQDIALREFDRLCGLSPDPKRVKERDGIPGIVAQGLLALRPYGIPSQTQGKIVHQFASVPVPILGYYDLIFRDSGVLVDIKTQLRLSSEISDAHSRQVSFYVHGTALEGRIAYVTPQKFGVYRVEDPVAGMNELLNIAHRMQKTLAVSDDPMEIAAMMVPDYGSFYYSDPLTKQNAREVFGFKDQPENPAVRDNGDA